MKFIVIVGLSFGIYLVGNESICLIYADWMA